MVNEIIPDPIPPPPPPRPSNFEWQSPKTSGGTFNLTAKEWNAFTSKINEFRAYVGLSEHSFSSAVKGNVFSASMYNQARVAIQAISGYGTYIPRVSSGDEISARIINVIVNELNAIP